MDNHNAFIRFHQREMRARQRRHMRAFIGYWALVLLVMLLAVCATLYIESRVL